MKRLVFLVVAGLFVGVMMGSCGEEGPQGPQGEQGPPGPVDTTTGSVIGNLIFNSYALTGSGLVEVFCPSGKLAVGGACGCSVGYLWAGGTVNDGSLQGQLCACTPPGYDPPYDIASVNCVQVVSEDVLQPASQVQEQEPGALLDYLQNLEE